MRESKIIFLSALLCLTAIGCHPTTKHNKELAVRKSQKVEPESVPERQAIKPRVVETGEVKYSSADVTALLQRAEELSQKLLLRPNSTYDDSGSMKKVVLESDVLYYLKLVAYASEKAEKVSTDERNWLILLGEVLVTMHQKIFELDVVFSSGTIEEALPAFEALATQMTFARVHLGKQPNSFNDSFSRLGEPDLVIASDGFHNSHADPYTVRPPEEKKPSVTLPAFEADEEKHTAPNVADTKP